MSIWSTLAKIGGVAAAPFTGGASLIPTILSAAGDIGSVVGKQQQGAATGRQQQEVANQSRDRNAVDLFGTQQNAQNQAGQLDLQRKGFETSNRSATAKQALLGALLGGGIQPTSMKDGQASGGLLRSLNANPDALAAMKLLGSQGATAQNAPIDFKGGQMLQAPKMSTPIEIDKGGIMSTLASVLQGAGAVGSYLPQGGGDPGPSPFVGSNNAPQLAGVDPFYKPGKAKMAPLEEDDDWSNR
jgi:hypothetical protein